MHCKVCNTELSDFESTRKDANTMQFLDMCNACISGANINTIDRMELASSQDLSYFDSVDDSWKYDNLID